MIEKPMLFLLLAWNGYLKIAENIHQKMSATSMETHVDRRGFQMSGGYRWANTPNILVSSDTGHEILV